MKSPAWLLLLFVIAIGAISAEQTKFYVILQWKYLNFTWPNEEVLKSAQAQGLYIPENNIIAGVKYFEDHFYLTLPRMKQGVPATLARIKAEPGKEPSPNLEPYPSWQMNSIDDCNGLQNVQNIEIDTKGQIWIIDGGRIDTLTDPIVKCPPKLLVFDIRRNATSIVYNFPEEVAMKNGSFLYDIVVDNTDGGYAYITDNSARDPGIIVYSVKENRSWKIRNERTMTANPQASTFTVNNVTISSPINIAGIALGPKVHTSNDKVVVNEAREVYFSPLSSLHLYSINTTTLRNENLARQRYDYTPTIKDVGPKLSQGGSMIMDNQGILYYGLLTSNAIGRWDSHTPFHSEQKLISRDVKFIEWPNSFTLDPAGNLTVLVNRLNRFITGKIDLNAYNFWLISAKVGGKSYLFDDNFNYQADNENKGTIRPQPVPDTRADPEPKPEPAPNDSTPSTTSTRAPFTRRIEKKIDSAKHDRDMLPASGSSLAGTLLPVAVCYILILL